METIFVKPEPGRIVRDPITMQPLPGDGDEKPRDTYWLRRLADGDVTEAAPPQTAQKEADKK
jgi:hypothetical protein